MSEDETPVVPEEPALSGLEAMADLMRRMKAELDSQFALFARAREMAEARLSTDLPEAEMKLCRADLKAAVEALSVIVRTLDKVDEMERRIMRDQQELATLTAGEADYAGLMEEVERAIELRVAERLARLAAPAVEEDVPRAGLPQTDDRTPAPDASCPLPMDAHLPDGEDREAAACRP